jgi:hypothetical protein
MASQFTLLGTHIQGVLNGIIDAVNGKAPSSHNHDDRYYTETETNNLLNTKVAVDGSTMTGNINWAQTDRGLTWAFNTDGAYIKFFNTGDGDTNSRLEFGTSDNGNEFFRWTIAGVEEATLKDDGLRVTNSIWSAGNLVATQSWVTSQGYLTSETDSQELEWNQAEKLLTISNGNAVDLSQMASVADIEAAGFITAESDTLATVTSRGASTSTQTTFSGNVLLEKSSGNNILHITSAAGGTPVLYMTSPSRGWGQFVDASDLHFKDETGNVVTMVLKAGGSVGIGTTAPDSKLEVNGRVSIRGGNELYFGQSTSAIGTWTTRTYASGSTHKFNAAQFIFNDEGYGSYEHMRLTYTGLNLNGKQTIDSTDSWLRLNQAGDYTSGVYTPAGLRNDGAFVNYGGIYGYANIQARKAQTAGDYTTAALWTESYDNTATGIAFHISGNVGKFLEMRTDGILYWEGAPLPTQAWVQSQGYLTSETDSQTLDWNQGEKTLTISNGNTVTLDGLTTEDFVTSQGYITGISFANVSSKPTTIAGYGITDAITTANIGSQGVTYAINSTRLYASDSPYRYGDQYPYSMDMRYDGSYWNLSVTPATPSAVRVAYSDNAGSANTSLTVTGKSSISYAAHEAGANDYNLELYSNDTGDGSRYVSLRFHQGNRYWGQIRYNSAGFRLTGGEDDSLNNLYAGVYYATDGNSTNWNTAYDWGNHASAGYQAASTAITTSNIASQSVSYATSAGSSGYASYTPRVAIEDTRAAQRTPNDYEDYRASWEFTNQIPGLSGSTWWSLMTVQGWHDAYSAWQIIGPSDAGPENWYLRVGNNTTWGTARRIWHAGDFTSTNISNWSTAYGWGNHADYGYWNTDSVDAKNVKSAEVVFAGNVTVEGTFTESSSIRFKENITPLDPALDKVNQLEAVSYNKIGADDREIGLIAEDVAELFPEVVTYNEDGQPQGIQYQRLSVILLKAVQELTERVNKLENK